MCVLWLLEEQKRARQHTGACQNFFSQTTNNTLHTYAYVGIYILCMCVSIQHEEESCRCITDLCRGGGGGQTRCATNRRRCAVVTHRQLLRPNEVPGRPCHDARDHLSLLVARFARSVQVSSWFVAQQNLSTIAARAYHYIERVGGLC